MGWQHDVGYACKRVGGSLTGGLVVVSSTVGRVEKEGEEQYSKDRWMGEAICGELRCQLKLS